MIVEAATEQHSRAVERFIGWINHMCPVQPRIDKVQYSQWEKCTRYSESKLMLWGKREGDLEAVLVPLSYQELPSSDRVWLRYPGLRCGDCGGDGQELKGQWGASAGASFQGLPKNLTWSG